MMFLFLCFWFGLLLLPLSHPPLFAGDHGLYDVDGDFDEFTDSYVVTAFVLACFLVLVHLPFVSSFLSFLPFSFFSFCRSLSLSRFFLPQQC